MIFYFFVHKAAHYRLAF